VINASDALSPEGGTITVRSHVDKSDGPPAWILEVIDDGHGMDGATCARIFDPFFTTKVTGHGLGLSAVLGIVSQLRGSISVDSSPGAGAHFTVRLPLQGGAAPEVVPRRAPGAAPLSGRRALIADDEDAVRVAVRRMLERRGAEVDAVIDGREARAAIAQAPYDLVFLDVNMPAGGAYDLLSEVRARRPAPKIVIMSGYSESFTAKPGALADDGDAFLQKPFSLAQLDEALRTLFA
jgi:CheY-like chemotaxis protein